MTLFWPMVVLVALTAMVWCKLYVDRFGEMRRRRLNPQDLSLRAAKATLLQDSRGADNFNNLLEAPVLFYVAGLVALIMRVDDALLLNLAWVYVILRIVHSVIHVTYNRVVHRFAVYALSCMVLWAMWARLAWWVWRAT